MAASSAQHNAPNIAAKERSENRSIQLSGPGESPPPPPEVLFGRDKLIEDIILLAEGFTSVALIGVGGIGKTSVALAVLGHGRIKERFGEHRRFIRCDQFPASLTHFLHRISEAIGANVKNPETLAPLYPFLSSEKMVVVLDNAESILDPQGTDGQKIYEVVEELSQFSNIFLCITSRITIIPPDCRTIEVPTLSMNPARDTFYGICQYGERSGLVDKILEQLDFHPLSISLLATVAFHSKWETDRLSKEWEQQRTSVLKTTHNGSLAATIELSLASPMFQELGPHARELLAIVAFFPQGVDENNFNWLFPTISNANFVFDRFCILSLTHRNDGFITMLAPLRDYLSPQDPMSSPLLRTTKESYFKRMSVRVDPNKHGFEDARWIRSEDVNVEHLLKVFTSIDPNSDDVWEACINFMRHIFWHKQRIVALRSNIEALSDDHPAKPDCLLELSQLFRSVGNHAANKEILTHASILWREREGGYRTAETLMYLAFTNRTLSFYKEGILQARESLEICERINHKLGQAHSLRCLAWMLRDDGQLDAAEDAASRAVDLFGEVRFDQYGVCQSNRALGIIRHRKGKVDEAIGNFETALKIASASKWPKELFWNNYHLAELFFDEGRVDDAYARIEEANSHVVDDFYLVGHGAELKGKFLHKQRRFEEAKSEVLNAIKVFEKLGTTLEPEKCRDLLRGIQKELSEAARQSADGRGQE